MKNNKFDYLSRLEKPEKKVDVVLDTDMYNEIDDLYALSYLILSEDKLNLQGVFAAPFFSPPAMQRTRQTNSAKEGMELSYKAILELLDALDRPDLKGIVYHGSADNLTDEKTPVHSEAADKLIQLARAHTEENPLYVVSIAVLTDIASAILAAPDIIDKIVVIWLGGHGFEWQSCSDFNAIQDIAAARVVFGCGAAVVQLPCNGVVSEFRVSKVEFIHWLSNKNKICQYLLELTLEFMEQKVGNCEWSKPLWDVAAVGWLLDSEFMMDRYEHSPVFEYDNRYGFDNNRHFIKYVYQINRDSLFIDMINKLTTNNNQET